MNVWERLQTTANGTKGGLKWIEAVVRHLSTYVLIGTLGDDSGSTSGSSRGSSSKSNSIAWLAHQLSVLHNHQNRSDVIT